MRYRVGRHNPQLVYAQSGDEPDTRADSLVAVCFTGDMAAVVRDALDASWPVEGSTPVASPAPARPRGLDALLGYVADRLDAAPAGEVVSVPPAEPDPMKEWTRALLARTGPDPVPPPVDALDEILVLVEEVALARVKAHAAANRDDGPRAAQHSDRAKAFRLAIAVKIEGLWAAGVAEGRRLLDETAATAAAHAYELGIAEGRRQRDAEIHAEVFASARAAAEAGFGPVPESVTVSYETSDPPRAATRVLALVDELVSQLDGVDGASAIRDEIEGKLLELGFTERRAGLAEGHRRQAAEVERLQVLLDHAEQYARDLQDSEAVDGD